MDINRANLDSLFTGFNTSFQAGMTRAALISAVFTMVVPSTTSMETYGWLELLSRMREWIGPRQIQDIESKKMSLTNRDFEHTIGVKRNSIEDDQLGIYAPLLELMGFDAEALWDKLPIDALVANGEWLDGAAFFGTARTYGANTIANYVTTALSESTFNTAMTTMQNYQGANDEPLGVTPTHLVFGANNRTVAHGILNQGPGATAANPNDGAVEPVQHPRLVGAYANYWYLMDCSSPVKPVALQKRKVGALERWDQDHDECVKNHNRNDYGVHSRGESGLTLPHLCYAGHKSA